MKRILIFIAAIATTLSASAATGVDDQQPLVIVEGKVMELEAVNSLDIESMTVFKGDSAEAQKFNHLGNTENGVIVISLKSNDETEEVFIATDVMPTFMGGDLLSFRAWVMENIRYPELAMKCGMEDLVVVNFIVNRHGYIESDNIKIIQSKYPTLVEEAKRVICSSPRWTPGINNGHPVPVSFVLPISFKIQGESTGAPQESSSTLLIGNATSDIVVVGFDGNVNQEVITPMFVIDGIVSTSEEAKSLSADRIKMMAVAKDDDLATLSYYKDFGDISNGIVFIHTKADGTTIADDPDTLPRFLDGDFETFYEWVMQNTHYPAKLKDKNLTAHLLAQYIINSAGYVEVVEIRTMKGTPDPLFDEEVRKVLLKSPRWTPATKDGVDVSYQASIPFIFGSMEITDQQ
ncbi:MAG: energy transducer TonB [Alistipes sp.]|nr:energy transducer TonB [Alistipes sp.]